MPQSQGYVYSHTERFRPLMIDVDEGLEIMAGVGGVKSKAHEHHHLVQTSLLPGVFFVYEIEPFRVEEVEVSRAERRRGATRNALALIINLF